MDYATTEERVYIALMADDEEPGGIKRFDRADQGRRENLIKRVEKEQHRQLDARKAQLNSELGLKQLQRNLAEKSRGEEHGEKEQDKHPTFGTKTLKQSEDIQKQQGSAERKLNTEEIAEDQAKPPAPEENMKEPG